MAGREGVGAEVDYAFTRKNEGGGRGGARWWWWWGGCGRRGGGRAGLNKIPGGRRVLISLRAVDDTIFRDL